MADSEFTTPAPRPARRTPRNSNRLTVRSVDTAKPGRHCDGRGLYLAVADSGAKKWVLRFTFNHRVTEIGLGNADVPLAVARDKAAGARKLIASGINPIIAKREAKRAAGGRKTFGECASELIASKRREWRSQVHAAQWRTTIDAHCGPILDKPVDVIDTQVVLGVLQPIWGKIPETASRLRGRIEAVLDYAKANGLRSGENPAAWRGHLALILPKRQNLTRGHLAAMLFDDVPGFIARLREREAMAALALEFLILTAARSGEVFGARWGEIDLDVKVWTVPAARMKSGKSHRVPLSSRAVAILETLAVVRTDDFVFPGRRGKPLSASAMVAVLSRMNVKGVTVHGFRSAFRDWAGETTSFPREIAEAALAHAIGNAVEQAYRRGDALEKRRTLMDTWASFCEPGQESNVVPLPRKAAIEP